jgi:hypothetical protein
MVVVVVEVIVVVVEVIVVEVVIVVAVVVQCFHTTEQIIKEADHIINYFCTYLPTYLPNTSQSAYLLMCRYGSWTLSPSSSRNDIAQFQSNWMPIFSATGFDRFMF